MRNWSPGDVDVFHGSVTSHVAQVYARVESRTGGGDWTLQGRIQGPHCRHAKTLPAVIRFVDQGSGPTLLARATLPDPCFWSPELPATYQVKLELWERNVVVGVVEKTLGMRNLGIRGPNFWWSNQRYVLRAIQRPTVTKDSWLPWRTAMAAVVTPEPDEELCRETSQEGVLVVARVDGSDANAAAKLRQLGSWPAAGLAIVSHRTEDGQPWRHFAPNLLLASEYSDPREQIPEWVQAVVVPADVLPEIITSLRATGKSLPVVAWRPVPGPLSLSEAHAACDELQRDLARFGDFAGYIV